MANNPGTDVAGADRQVEVGEVAGVVKPIGPSIRALCTIGALLVGFLALGAAGGAFGATMDAFDHRGANRATLIGVGLALALVAAGLSWLAWRLGLYGAPGFKRPEPHG